MVLEIIAGIIIEATIGGASKTIKGIFFRETDIRDWIKKIDFETTLEQEIDFENIPPENIQELKAFFSSETVSIIVEQIFLLNESDLSELEEDFVKAYNVNNPVQGSEDTELPQKLFSILIDASVFVLYEAVKKGNLGAKECLDVLKYKKNVSEQNGHSSKKFISWNEYFTRVETNLLPQTGLSKFERTTHYVDESEIFVSDTLNKILIIYAPGGSGKSHMLRHIASVLEEKHPEYSVLSITSISSEMNKALSLEIKKDKKYILIFDDADRWSKELASLFSFIRNNSSNVKVILSSRTAGLQSIRNILINVDCCNITKEIELKDWSKEDLKALLQFTIGGEVHEKEDIVVTTYPNPYLIVWAGNTINGNPGITIEKLQIKFVNDLESDTFKSLIPDFTEIQAKNFLADLSLVAPFQKKDPHILSLLAKKYGIKEENLIDHISLLEKNGVLRQPGLSTRFNPDMKGDLYLAHRIEQLQDSNKLGEWINSWGQYIAGKILTNLEAASKYCKNDVIRDYFQNWISQKNREARETSSIQRQNHLEYLSRFCYILPEDSVDLLYTYIDTPLPNDPDETYYYGGKILLTTNDYGPIISQLILTAVSREDIFDLMDHVYNNVSEGSYHNYKIESLVSETVSPFKNTHERIRQTLTVLENRLDESNEYSIVALGEAVSKVLQVTHDTWYSPSFATITNVTLTLPDTPIVTQTRDHAMLILKRMLAHSSITVRRKGIDICRNIGLSPGKNNKSLSMRIAEERRDLLKELEQLFVVEIDYGVLSDIESLLLEWWWRRYPDTEEAERLLKSFPRSMEYILYRSLFYSGIKILSFEPETIPSGKKERNEWYFNVTFAFEEDLKDEFIEYIVDNYLYIHYQTRSSIIAFFKGLQLYSEQESLKPQYFNEIMIAWVEKCAERFLDLRNQNELWDELPAEFQNAIDIGLCEHDSELIDYLADEIFSALPEVNPIRINAFVYLMAKNPPDEAKIHDWLGKLIKTGNKDIHMNIFRNLFALSSNLDNYEVCITYSLNIFQYYNTEDKQILDAFSTYILYQIIGKDDILETALKEKLKKCLIEKLIFIPIFRMDNFTFQTQKLINYVLTDPNDIIDFMHRRNEKMSDISTTYYVLPVGKISLLENIQNCTELYPVIKEMITLLHENATYREGICQQLKSIVTLKSSDSERLCLEECIKQFLQSNDVESALIVCYALPFKSETQDTILDVLSTANNAGKKQEIIDLFDKYIQNVTVTMDGKSPELIEKKQFIAGLFENSPRGSLRILLKDILTKIEVLIQENMKIYEEHMIQR